MQKCNFLLKRCMFLQKCTFGPKSCIWPPKVWIFLYFQHCFRNGPQKCKNVIFSLNCPRTRKKSTFCSISTPMRPAPKGEKWQQTFPQLRSRIRRVRIDKFVESFQNPDFFVFSEKCFYKSLGFLKILQKATLFGCLRQTPGKQRPNWCFFGP